MDELIRLSNIITPLQVILLIGIILFGLILGYYIINIGNRYLERSKRIVINIDLVKRILIGLIVFLIVIALLRKYPILGTVFGAAFVAIILAYVINPLVESLKRRGLNRKVAVGVVYLSIFIVLTILLIVVIPRTIQETRNLILAIPYYAESFATVVSDFVENFQLGDTIPGASEISESISNSYGELVRQFTEWLTGSASKATVFITHLIQNIIAILFTLFLVLIMTFYFLVDKEMYIKKIRKLIPDKLENDITYLAIEIDEILTEFIRGRIILAIFVGIFTAILLLILRIDFAIVIGVITCVADIIPYIGPLLGFIPAFLFALIESPLKALVVAVFYVLIQWAENNILAPKIIGDSMGLNPLFVFLAIVIGGGVFGVWGMIIAVPLAAIILTLIDFGRNKYKDKKAEKVKDGIKFK